MVVAISCWLGGVSTLFQSCTLWNTLYNLFICTQMVLHESLVAVVAFGLASGFFSAMITLSFVHDAK